MNRHPAVLDLLSSAQDRHVEFTDVPRRPV